MLDFCHREYGIILHRKFGDLPGRKLLAETAHRNDDVADHSKDPCETVKTIQGVRFGSVGSTSKVAKIC